MGLFSSSKKEMEMPSAQDFYDQAEGYYKNYQQWTGDETSRYERDIATTKSRYSAGGGRGDSEYLNKLTDARTTSYHEAMADLEGGEHGKFLTKYLQDVKSTLKSSVASKEYRNQSHKVASGNQQKRNYGVANEQFFNQNIPQELRDQRNAADEAQDFIKSNTTTNIAGQESIGPSSQLGALSHSQFQSKLNESRATIATADKATTAFNERIDAMTMDDLFGAEFGRGDEGQSLEDKAIKRAQTGAGGGVVDEERSAWWG